MPNNHPEDLISYLQFALLLLERLGRRKPRAIHFSHLPMLRRMKANHSVLRKAVNAASGSGPIFEFGVYKGASLRLLAKLVPEAALFGFDSFAGFPEDGRTDWDVDFAVNTLPDMPPNVTLVPGYFNETLPQFLSEHGDIPSLRLLNIDCDIYSSTKTVLDHLDPYIGPGLVISFDELLYYAEFLENEFLALYEFLQRRELDFEWIAFLRHYWALDDFLAWRKIGPHDGGFRALRNRGYHQTAAIRIVPRAADYDVEFMRRCEKAELLATQFGDMLA